MRRLERNMHGSRAPMHSTVVGNILPQEYKSFAVTCSLIWRRGDLGDITRLEIHHVMPMAEERPTVCEGTPWHGIICKNRNFEGPFSKHNFGVLEQGDDAFGPPTCRQRKA